MEDLINGILDGKINSLKKFLEQGGDPNLRINDRSLFSTIFFRRNSSLYSDPSNLKIKKRYNSVLKLLLLSGAQLEPYDLNLGLSSALDARDLSLFKLFIRYGGLPDLENLSLIFNQEDEKFKKEILKFFPSITVSSRSLPRSIKLDGKKYPLSIIIIENNNSLALSIPFPTNYPETEFRKNNDFIGYVYMTLKKKGIYISSFGINTYPRDEYGKRFKVRKGEREGTKGVGKLLLCTGIEFLSRKNKLNPKTRVDLIAGGARCLKMEGDYISEIQESIRERFPQKYEKILEKGKNWYQEYFRLFYPRMYYTAIKEYPDYLPIFYCQMKDNFKLADYYSRYGFKIKNESDFYSIKMSAQLEDVLESCSDSIISE